jgi:hypothetical protein
MFCSGHVKNFSNSQVAHSHAIERKLGLYCAENCAVELSLRGHDLQTIRKNRGKAMRICPYISFLLDMTADHLSKNVGANSLAGVGCVDETVLLFTGSTLSSVTDTLKEYISFKRVQER